MTKPQITIIYCTKCKWLLRAAWMAQELLSTFEQEAGEVSLKPDDSGGVFEIRIGEDLIFSRSQSGRFPDIKELKQMVRDKIAPEKNLGHTDRA